MRVFTPGMKVIDGLCGTRVCLLLVFVFACFSSSVTAASNILVPLRHPSNLASQERNSSVTIVFKNIDTKNRIAVDFARRKFHRKILDYLKSKKSTAASTFWTTAAPSTSFVSTTVTTVSTHDITSTTTTTSTTPSTTTTAATTITATPITTTTVNPTTSSTPTTPSTTTTSTPSTTSTTTTLPSTSTTTTAALTTTPTSTIAQPPPTHGDKERRRKRRNSGGNNDKLTDDDLSFIRNDDELSENGNFVISIFIHKEGFGDLDLSELLHEAANELIKPGPIQGSAFSPQLPVSIYRGLPKELSPVETPQLSLNFWLLILAISALLLVFIFIFVRYWSSGNKKMGGTLA